MSSVFSHDNKDRGETLNLFYEDDKVALDTTRSGGPHYCNGHEIMLDAEAVENLIQALTTMQANIRARYQKAITS